MNTAALYLAAAANTEPFDFEDTGHAPFDVVNSALSSYLFETFPELEYTFTYTDEINKAKEDYLNARGWTVAAYDRALAHSIIIERKAAIEAGLIDP